jgi:two-component system cell cycle sensor histidine kinase/response regulator CckA
MNGRGQIDVSTKLIYVDMELSDSLDIRPGAYVRIDVSDHGEGMSEEIMRQVFDPFFTTREVGVGTGLGLSTVYGIVRDWGGTVSVQSAVGEGTTFSVMVPCVT